MKNKTAAAVLCAALGNIIWGFSFLFTKTGISVVGDPNILLAHRFTVSTLVMLGMMLAGKGRVSFKGKNWRPVVILLLMQLSYYLFESYGILYTNSTMAGLVLAVVPVVTVGTGALFLKEYPTKRQALFCVLPVVGVIVISVSGNELGVMTPLGGLFLLFLLILAPLRGLAGIQEAQPLANFCATRIAIPFAVTFLKKLPKENLKE